MPETLNPALLALRPRQVVLLSKQNMKSDSNTSLNSGHNSLLLHSVARFLDRNGFSKTLKKFLSESQIQVDALKDSSPDLEQLYIKYIEMGDDAKTNLKSQKEQDKPVGTDEGKKLEPQPKELGKDRKDKKKKKSKLISESESIPSTAEEKLADVTDTETHKKKGKDKEKKKKPSTHDSLIDNVDSEAVNSTALDTNGAPVEEKSSKSKSKKKKKDDSKDITVNGSAVDDSKISEADAVGEGDKGSKKRKRLVSDENDLKPTDAIATEEPKRRKIEGTVENGNLGKSAEKTSMQKSNEKQRNGSAEPKTVDAFQRVKVEEVEFIDERLKDNSYWAKDGAETGYGAKAQEVFGQVRGRDFRHEKTKKKRGSYRGGQIDLQSHSVKFNYSDDE